MKKSLIAVLLTVGMTLSMVACGAADEPQDTPNTEISTEEDSQTPEENVENVDNAENDADAVQDNTESTPEDNAAANDKTMGQTLYNTFADAVAANPEATSEELANAVLANAVIEFMGGAMAVEAGYLAGFGNAEITGFTEASMFAPMISTIPFVGYVFILPEDADVDAFKTTLSDNADLRWNICTEADEKVVESIDNKVFFLMCRNANDGE